VEENKDSGFGAAEPFAGRRGHGTCGPARRRRSQGAQDPTGENGPNI